MKNKIIFRLFALALMGLYSCSPPMIDQNGQVPVVSVKTEPLKYGHIEDYLNLNGKTVCLKKNLVVSPIAGYVMKANVNFGDRVRKNDVLFEIQTKEGKALENTGDFTPDMGLVQVLAPSDGLINAPVVLSSGAYVVEGGELCSIINSKDIKVKVNVPFKYSSMLKPGDHCTIFLSDNSMISGSVLQKLPFMDEANQIQDALIGLQTDRQLPENLYLVVQFVAGHSANTFLVKKSALMANETQNRFWIMKVENSNLAVEVPVNKGIENDSLVEIFSSLLNENDLVITQGAYSLPDSTVVSISE